MNISAAASAPAEVRSDERKKNKTQKGKSKNIIVIIVLILAMLGGVGMMLYPSIADYWNKNFTSRAINEYSEQVMFLDEEDYGIMLEQALAYNEQMAKGTSTKYPGVEIPKYKDILNPGDLGIMGVVEIDEINVSLPIYHGTDEDALAIAIGHLEWSSLPIGAASFDDDLGVVTDPDDGAHCVISGHRGLPSARLFTDIDQMVVGDIFVIRCLNEILAYEVDQIRVVEPEDLSTLHIEKGHDYCTLVTCTPYGVNSHRLLVRGSRISSKFIDRYLYRVQANAVQINKGIVAALIAAPVLLALFAIALITGLRKRKIKTAALEEQITMRLAAMGMDQQEKRMFFKDMKFEFSKAFGNIKDLFKKNK